MYSISEENYIKSIYHLQRNNENVLTNELAANLNTKPASVTDMLKKLQAKGLLSYEKYYGCRLTEAGKSLALGIVRRHRLWEYFLSEKLGFGWEEVHEVAEQLEHVKSSLLTEKLDEFLGFPRFDPHGDPIPDMAGNMAILVQKPLEEWPLNTPGIVCGVGRQDDQLLEMLRMKKLEIGVRIIIKQHYAFDHSMDVLLENDEVVTLSEQLAQNLFVKSV
jgi:DtxR family Mn-dependent transcriptional regulator